MESRLKTHGNEVPWVIQATVSATVSKRAQEAYLRVCVCSENNSGHTVCHQCQWEVKLPPGVGICPWASGRPVALPAPCGAPGAVRGAEGLCEGDRRPDPPGCPGKVGAGCGHAQHSGVLLKLTTGKYAGLVFRLAESWASQPGAA